MYKLHSLNQGGTNVQGVPMGLVNWMCYNRAQTRTHQQQTETVPELVVVAPRRRRGQRRIRKLYGTPAWLSAVLWADLALTLQGAARLRGFLTINELDWRAHNQE